MTISSSGYSGTVTEAGWAGLAGALAPYAEAGGWLVSAVTANGLAQVTVAAGYVTGCGVRAFTDGTTAGGSLLTLTPPATGGAWFLIVARRTWSPTATTTLVAVAGPTTGSTAVPSAPPATFPVLNNTPGTLHDQPLAWAFVAAGSTTVTLWDMRLQRTGAGALLAPSAHALNAYVAAGTLGLGAVVKVAQFVLQPSGATVRHSTWRVGNTATVGVVAAVPLEPLWITGGTADLTALLSTLTSLYFWPNVTKAYHEPSGITYLYVGAGNTALGANAPTSAWQAWSKPATAFTPTWLSGVTIGSSTATALWGISEGRLSVDVFVQAGTGYALTSSWSAMTLPSPVAGQMSSGSGSYGPAGASSSGSPIPLQPFTVSNPAGISSTAIRIGVPQVSGTLPQTPKLVQMQAGIPAPATTDNFFFSITAPSALVG